MTIPKEKRKLIEKIAKKYSLELLLLFGSRVSRKNHKASDFDIAYLSRKKLDLMDEAKMIVDLFPVFNSRKVDLASIKNASPLLMKQIFQNHIVLFCSNIEKYNQYKIYAVKRYIEAKPLFELREKLINKYFAKHA